VALLARLGAASQTQVSSVAVLWVSVCCAALLWSMVLGAGWNLYAWLRSAPSADTADNDPSPLHSAALARTNSRSNMLGPSARDESGPAAPDWGAHRARVPARSSLFCRRCTAMEAVWATLAPESVDMRLVGAVCVSDAVLDGAALLTLLVVVYGGCAGTGWSWGWVESAVVVCVATDLVVRVARNEWSAGVLSQFSVTEGRGRDGAAVVEVRRDRRAGTTVAHVRLAVAPVVRLEDERAWLDGWRLCGWTSAACRVAVVLGSAVELVPQPILSDFESLEPVGGLSLGLSAATCAAVLVAIAWRSALLRRVMRDGLVDATTALRAWVAASRSGRPRWMATVLGGSLDPVLSVWRLARREEAGRAERMSACGEAVGWCVAACLRTAATVAALVAAADGGAKGGWWHWCGTSLAMLGAWIGVVGALMEVRRLRASSAESLCAAVTACMQVRVRERSSGEDGTGAEEEAEGLDGSTGAELEGVELQAVS
jgi:hypothetical protein